MPTRVRSKRPPGAATPASSPDPAKQPSRAETARLAEAQAALAAALDPIITIDVAGVIRSASDSVQRVLGWSPSELLGQNVSLLMPEPHHSAHDGYLASYRRTGKTNIMNRPRRFEALRKDGVRIPIELCVSRAEMPGGEPLFVGIIRDMSDYAAAERSRDEERVRYQQLLADQTTALQMAHLRLRMADRMATIGTLAAGLGHDMNNVLLPVRARLNALRAAGEAGRLGGPERSHVEEVRKSVAYLQQLADGLHFLAMDPDAEDREGRAATDLAEWWRQAGALLSKSVPKHVRVSASIPTGLPRVPVAAHGLTQAMLNLVVNAGEAIPGIEQRKRRQGLVKVWAHANDGGALVTLGVTDNGAGMSEDVRRRAFEMFFTTKPRGLGTGLGLALVHKVVSRAGGSIEIQSEPGKGTTVSMTFPAATGSEGSARSAAVTLADGRAAALVRHLLEGGGTAVRADNNADLADIWVLAPQDSDPRVARAWRRIHPAGRLVLMGRPAPVALDAWRALDPIIVEATQDYESVRAAIGHAVSDQRSGGV